MKAKSFSLLFLLALAFGMEGSLAAQQLHPKLTSKEKSIRKVLILPPRVEVARQSMKGPEAMIKESEELGEAVSGIVAQALRERGVNVVESPLSAEGLKDNSDLRYALADMQKRYDELAPKLARNQKDVKKGRFSLGDVVANFGPAASADTLIFVRGEGSELTKGKQAFGILVTGATRSRIVLSIAGVDAQKGDVLFFTTAMGSGGFVQNPQKVLAKPIAKSIRKLPSAA